MITALASNGGVIMVNFGSSFLSNEVNEYRYDRGDTLPIGLKYVSKYPNLIDGFLRRGYSDEDIRKILAENLLRVWGEVEAFAAADW